MTTEKTPGTTPRLYEVHMRNGSQFYVRDQRTPGQIFSDLAEIAWDKPFLFDTGSVQANEILAVVETQEGPEDEDAEDDDGPIEVDDDWVDVEEERYPPTNPFAKAVKAKPETK